ncbi:MAG: outer membrane beta-barrel protein [Acidobacteria bacterium]|nr:outer membrane beta-barrel protein [Acidobacteriota bacterium]
MRRFPKMLATALMTIGASSAAAQSQSPPGVQPLAGRATVFLNGGLQIASQDLTRSSTFSLYDEEARLDIAQNDIEGGGFVEIGGSYRFLDQIGAGLSFMSVDSKGDATVDGSIPHPLEFDLFRQITGSESNLRHKETAVHLFATYHMPLTEKIDLTFSAGPSFFNISQDFVRSITFSEAPPFTSVTLDGVERTTIKKNGVGFNIGADATYGLTRFMGFDLGVGAMARYTRGGADFDVTDGESVNVKGGGFQIGGGVRVRF